MIMIQGGLILAYNEAPPRLFIFRIGAMTLLSFLRRSMLTSREPLLVQRKMRAHRVGP